MLTGRKSPAQVGGVQERKAANPTLKLESHRKMQHSFARSSRHHQIQAAMKRKSTLGLPGTGHSGLREVGMLMPTSSFIHKAGRHGRTRPACAMKMSGQVASWSKP